MDWTDRRVVVTGATGFIGSHLCERLLSLGAHVRALSHGNGAGHERFLCQCPPELRSKLSITGGDLCDQDLLDHLCEGADTVFHVGAITSVAYSYEHPQKAFQTNVMGTATVCEAARKAGVRRLVHTSSGGQYGDAVDGKPITESHPLTGRNPYTASKIGADYCCETYYRSYNLPVSICRIFNVYGPRIGRFLIMPTIIMQLLESDTLRLGDLRPYRSFTYIDDIITAFVRMGEEDSVVGEVVHFGSDRVISMRELVDLIADLMGKSPAIETDEGRFRPKKSEIQRTVTDASKARRLLGWTPKVSLEDGLRRTIDWIAAGGYDDIRETQSV